MSASPDGGVRSYIPKETPDIGCGEVDPICSTELIDLDLFGNSCVGKYDHLKRSAFVPGRRVSGLLDMVSPSPG